MGKLKITFEDVYETPLDDTIDLWIENQSISDSHRLIHHRIGGALVIDGLKEDPIGLYKLQIEPLSYYTVSRFVRIPASGEQDLTIEFPVDIDKITSVLFEPYVNFSPIAHGLLEKSTASCA